MGMFDNIRCEFPLPDGFDGKLNFQTKDLENLLSTYVITADGKLLLATLNYDDGDKLPVLTVINYHGDIEFYGSNICSVGRGYFSTSDGGPPLWRNYTARFTNGLLQEIKGGESVPEIYATMKQVPRGEIQKYWDEAKK